MSVSFPTSSCKEELLFQGRAWVALLRSPADWVSLVLSVQVRGPDGPRLGRRWEPELVRVQGGDPEVSMSSLCITSSVARLFIWEERS